MSAKPTNLNEILNLSRKTAAENIRTLAIFDLDSTLFNVSTRSQKILQEFAEKYKIAELMKLQIQPSDWGIKEALFREGYTLEKDHELLTRLRDFWSVRFFSNEYLHYDVPYLGAINYVNELLNSGCEVQYLTGRDSARMQNGTIEVLKKWGFPLISTAHLHMKPEINQDDEIFKYEWFKNFNSHSYGPIYFFENEPININAVLNLSLPIQVIYLETTHSRKQEVTATVMRIKNYERSV